MPRTSIICLLAVLLAGTARAEDVKDALNHKYKKQILALRTPFTSSDLKFDSAGQPLDTRAAGLWLIYGGIYVQKLGLSSDTLRIEGPRGILSEQQKNGDPLLIALSKPVRIQIHLAQPLKLLDDAEAVLGRVFFLGSDAAEHAQPEFRRADDSTAGETIYHVGKNDRNYPKPVYTPEPDFSEEARKAHFQGNVVLNVVIDKVGNVERVRIKKAAGRGLDQNAVESVKQWRFEPATRNGKPVAVEMDVEVGFNLY